MTAYISGFKKALEQETAAAVMNDAAEVDKARERLTPLQDRLRRLLATIPQEVQREGLSLPTMQTMLRGRRRGCAHPGEIGAALRAAGFVRRRQWSNDKGFRSLWLLPDNETAREV